MLLIQFPRIGLGDEPSGFAGMEERTFVAEHDQTPQKYVILMPQGFLPKEKVSVLVALHGHGSDRWQFVREERGECRATRDVAAKNGMLLVSPDYRAKTSWMGPAAEADVAQIIGEIRKEFNVQRVLLCGGSMGGTGALTFSALHPEMIDGVITLNGTANLVEYARFQDAIQESFGGSKQQVPQQYRTRSAEFFPEQFTMPMAATTGGKDDVVPADSVLRLLAEVRKINRDVLNIHRPDGGHSTSYEDTSRAMQFVVEASDRLLSDD
jgi:pimeloyl-ACP methyl ester carboxylesterase